MMRSAPRPRPLRLISGVVSALVFMVSVYASSFALEKDAGEGKTTKELYELSERCGKICAQRFKEKFGKEGVYSDKGKTGTRSYSSHYNAKLKKCFILTTDSSVGPTGLVVVGSLWDINENKEYGKRVESHLDKDASFKCDVLETPCKSKQEWDALVKPYMEE